MGRDRARRTAGMRGRSSRGRPLLAALAGISAGLLLVSGLSVSAITASVDVAPTAIGPPEHTFDDDGVPGGPTRRVPIPRSAFERVRPSCPAPIGATTAPVRGSGGSVQDVPIGGVTYRLHVFSAVGNATFTVEDALAGGRIEVLVVAGGGGGGKRHGGGGGAGGLVLGTLDVSPGQSFPVTVGAGGAGAGTGSSPTQATNGGSSSFGSGDARLLSLGGGHGARFSDQAGADERAGAGGSGGGARSRTGGGTEWGAGTQPAQQNRCATLNAGHRGGAASGMWPGGGGGGAGGQGGTVGQGAGQVGGPGIDLAGRFGTGVGASGWFAGGGGGAPASTGTFAGGQGGGGTGQGGDTAGGPGAAGTGGGGGGARSSNGAANITGGAGGSGVVIVRYRIAPGPVRDAVAGESKDAALVRWRVPTINPPTSDTAYRVERQPVSASTGWSDVTGSTTFTTIGSGADREVSAAFSVAAGERHRFRITPLLGAEEGAATVVESLGKGGDEVRFVGQDVVHVFGTVGAGQPFVLSQPRDVRHLIVAGGAGGASGRGGGGGGAGGLLRGTLPFGAGDHAVTVGAGGAGGGSSAAGTNGGASSLGDRTAVGGGGGNFCGGGGSAGACDGLAGGSGGGTRHNSGRAGGPGTAGQGNAGARGLANGFVGGGGGGAGGGGVDGSTSGSTTGRGGPGVQDDITGDLRWYAAGGGGGGTDGRVSDLANGGEGGGGRGARDGEGGQAATTPGGGGGGGGSLESQAGGRGADGVVVVRYAFVVAP
jgi:hypothetical protein